MPQDQTKYLYTLAYWLFFSAFCVFTMIIVGAITRLTGSGLSMVEWRPLVGTIPPLNDAEWSRVFELYKESPEFQKKNFWMGVDDFKIIFFWEWFHRLMGRLIGLIYALPLFFFLAKGWIPSGYKLRLFGLLILGGLQGLMGWYMVKSGLVDIPAVSHYRLAAHLSLAFLIISFLIWLGLSFRKIAAHTHTNPDSALYNHGLIALTFLALTICWGAYTAGLDAGLVYNDTFPHMGDNWIPEEVWFYKPVWLNFFENHAGVQFIHRWLAMITVAIVISFTMHAGYKNRTEKVFIFLGIFVLAQMTLGIVTLYSHVNLHAATAHQAGAVILLISLITCLHATRFTQPSQLNR